MKKKENKGARIRQNKGKEKKPKNRKCEKGGHIVYGKGTERLR